MYTLHRFVYSPYARKVQRLLEVLAQPLRVVEVPYGNREELARLTDGWIYVPVVETPDGRVLTESRRICEELLARHAHTLVPAGMEAAVWAYHDLVEGPIEDTLFRIASPRVRDAWTTAWERALYTLVKERRYGAGCVDAWDRERDTLLARARELLDPTARALAEHPWVLGDRPSFADIALYGQWAMLDAADPSLVASLGARFADHARRVEALGPGDVGAG